MVTTLGYFISFASLMGYVFSAHFFLKVPFRLSPLFSICTLMVLLFWAALADMLFGGAILFLVCGCLSWLFLLFAKFRGYTVINDERWTDSLKLFLFLICLAFLCSLVGRLSVIDDYAFWAIVSKSIATYDALPTANTPIFARHLTYTNGLALFQYFFFVLSPYKLTISYFAQNLLLVSLLLAVTDGQDGRKSTMLIGCSVIVLVLFSGSVFQKLRADHFLYLTSAVIVWTYMRNRFSLQHYFVAAMALICLYLIKEVGFFLAVFLVLLFFLDQLFSRGSPEARRKFFVLWLLPLILFTVEKVAWDNHCTSLGFKQFHSSITFDAVKTAFDLTGNGDSLHGLFLFLKSISLGAADRLSLPYLAWYIILAILWSLTLRRYSPAEHRRHFLLLGLSMAFFLLYLAMNYVMQMVIFGLGTTREEPTSLDRYVNIFLCWFILFTLYSFITNRFAEDKNSKRHWPISIVLIAGLLVAGSSLPEKRKPYEEEIQQIWQQLEKYGGEQSRVCITPGKVADNYLGFRLLYYLFPTRVNFSAFPQNATEKMLDEKLATCNYLLVYLPDNNTEPLFSQYTSAPLAHRSLFKVVPLQKGNHASLKLELIH